VRRDWPIIESFSAALLADAQLAKKVVGIHGITYEYFDADIRDNRDLAMLAMTSGRASQRAYLGRFKDDPEILIASVKHNGLNYRSLPEPLRDNKALLLEALEDAAFRIYRTAPEHLQKDREVVLAALRAQHRLITETDSWRGWNIGNLGSIPSVFLADVEIVVSLDQLLTTYSEVTSSDIESLRGRIFELILRD